jgi:hypothetical protein
VAAWGRRPGVAAAWRGGGLERRLPGGGGPGVVAAWRGGCQGEPELGLAEAKKISGSDYHARGDGLQRNWMPVLLNWGYNI